MKVLYLLSDFFASGGVARYNKSVLSSMGQLGVDLTVVSINDTRIESGLPFIFKPCGDDKRWMSKFKFFGAAMMSALAERPEFIVCGHLNFAPLCYLLSLLTGIKFTILTYGIEAWGAPSSLQRAALRRAMLVITISEHTKKRMLDWLPELADKIFLLPPTVDEREFFPKNQTPELAGLRKRPNEKVLLTISRFSGTEKYKGHDKILEALPAVLRVIPDVRCVFVGTGSDLPRIKFLTQTAGLAEYVAFPGFVPQESLVDYYNACDVFLMPSKGEGFGIVFIEALACGKPVIAGKADGSFDAVAGGELGVLVDPDSKEEIAASVISVLNREAAPALLDAAILREKVLAIFGKASFQSKVKAVLTRLAV